MRVGSLHEELSPAGRTPRRGAAATAALASVVLVGALLAPASAEAAAAAGSPLQATAADQVSLTFPLQTRVASAQPIEPGDHVAVTVGTVTHKAPAPGQWICPTGVWVLELDRASLDEAASSDYPMCTGADTVRLGEALKAIPSTRMVIVNSLNHAPGGDARVLPGLGAVLAQIGAPADEFAAIDLARTGLSVYGVAGLSAGQAYTGIDDLAGEAGVPGGSPTRASVNGTMVRDNYGNFALTMPGYVVYDIAEDGTITLGGRTYPVPARPAGFTGGFRVLVVDRRSLLPISDTLYSTNDNPAGQGRMGMDLARLAAERGRSVLIFLATIGDPGGPAGPPGSARDLPVPCQNNDGPAYTVTCVFKPTAPADGGSEQRFVVPATVAGNPVGSLHVVVQGGHGGYAKSGGQGGLPDRVTADLTVGSGGVVAPGQTLYVEVAGEGTSGGSYPGGLGGWNGGGAGGSAEHVSNGWPGGGGGGASDIRTVSRTNGNTAASLAARLVVAAGGGGAGGDSHDAGRGGDGGHAGSAGGDGLPGTGSRVAGGGGGAGTATQGGAGGTGDATAQPSEQGRPGQLGTGGTGPGVGNTGGAAGGGGGGYYGGGSGGAFGTGGGGGGGGGGSDLVPAGGSVAPVVATQPASVTISYPAPYGTLAQALRPFGATPGVINGLGGSPRYALVGALNTPAAATAGLSPDSPEASPQILKGATGELQGVLQPGHESMWYTSVTSNVPVIRDVNGQKQPPTVTNYGLYRVLSSVDAPWPVPAPGPRHDAQQSALTYISQQVAGVNDIRTYYRAEPDTILTWYHYVSALSFPAGQNDFRRADFSAVKTQLATELDDVHTVDGLQASLHTLLSDQQHMLQPALQDAYRDVRDSIDVDNGAKATSIVGFILQMLQFAATAAGFPPVAAAFGIMNATLKFSTDLANNANGERLDALATTAAQLGSDTAENFAAALTSLSQIFSYLVANWGKLDAVATGLTHDAPQWDINFDTDAGQYITTAAQAAKLGYYRALIPDIYHRYEAKAAPHADLAKWCLIPDYPRPTECYDAAAAGFAYGVNAYTFPVQSPVMSFAPAHDNILISSISQLRMYPLPSRLMTQLTGAGLYVPYLFLRWPLAGLTCPVDLHFGGNFSSDFYCLQGFQSRAPRPNWTVTTTSLPNATVGQRYHSRLTAIGPSGATTHWTLGAGSRLPPGITLDAAGLLSGVPTAAGRYQFSVAVGDPATATLTLTVRPAAAPPGAITPAQPASFSGELAATGVPTLPLLALAALLFLAGIPLSLTGRRRRRHQPGHPRTARP